MIRILKEITDGNYFDITEGLTKYANTVDTWNGLDSRQMWIITTFHGIADTSYY